MANNKPVEGDVVTVKGGTKTYVWAKSTIKKSTGYTVAKLEPGGPNPGAGRVAALAMHLKKVEL